MTQAYGHYFCVFMPPRIRGSSLAGNARRNVWRSHLRLWLGQPRGEMCKRKYAEKELARAVRKLASEWKKMPLKPMSFSL